MLDAWAGERCGPHIGEAQDRLQTECGIDRGAYEGHVLYEVEAMVRDWLERLANERGTRYEGNAG